jgi:hypothetical protein
MTIDEAIKVLEDIQRFVKPGDPPEEHTAIGLGTEALKHVKAVRTFSGSENPPLLPGETEE